MFEKLKNKITNKLNSIKQEEELYKQLLTSAQPIKSLYPLTHQTTEIPEHKQKFITHNCPDINDEKAKIIAQLLALEETMLEVYYAKEILTQKEYFIVPTNLRLWIISTEGYLILPLHQTPIQIVKNNLMSKTVSLNNNLYEINGGTEKITKLITILTNPELRQMIVNEKISYLCGISPIYQKINSINSGISLDKDNNIVFHTKENNTRCHISEVINYELILDNQVCLSKNSYKQTSITGLKNSCYKINLRITKQNQTQILIPILEPSDINTKYESTGTTYKTNIAFATEIINKIKDLTEPKY
jgi:hypothetical protein